MKNNELTRRRTFGIISHPDAGKTTLTEKLLLFGGAIHTAGAVKSNKIVKTATSDFMEIEKQRGISVATSVMGFEYNGYKINILDTPGHKDFAEDTYRTLTAVDSVILVVDSAKGVEEQTRKLMNVCRMRSTPVIIFINKMDREGRDPFALLDELERELGIHTRPLTWPVGMGATFQGVYSLFEKQLKLFAPNKTRISDDVVAIDDLSSSFLDENIGKDSAAKLREDVGLIEGVYEPFDTNHYLEAYLAPVFFGSAINNFGVKELLDTFVEIAPSPSPGKQPSEQSIRQRMLSADLSLKFMPTLILTIGTGLHSAGCVPARSNGISITTIPVWKKEYALEHPRVLWRTKKVSSTRPGPAMWWIV